MLLLARCENESVMIGDEIEVKIARIDGANVCLAIQAPKNILINRKEVHNQIKSVMNNQKKSGSLKQ
jgi:carbon storage regulator